MKNDVFDLSLTHFRLFKPVPTLGLTYRIPANNNIESALKQHWSSMFMNVVSTLKFGWKWKLNRGMFIDVVSKNYVDSTTLFQQYLKELCQFNNVVPTIFRWKRTLSNVCSSALLNVEKRALNQICQYFLTDVPEKVD